MPIVPTQAILDDPNENLHLFSNIRKDILVLSGMFTELTRQMYLDINNLYPHVRPWSPTNEKGNHPFIESSNVWDDENVNRRPAIIIDMGDLAYSKNRVQGIGSQSGFDLEEGVEIQRRVVTGSVVWAHLGKTRGQALQYSSTTLDLMDGFSNQIRKEFCFEKLDVRGMFKATKRKEAPQEWESRVQADFMFQEAFTIKRESPKLKQLTARIQAELAQSFNMVK